ncbi:uncharacterized protein EDB91DRAFT_1088494, partial [Suillus paluster]|uniref:uncharacterized protein n=1 Tax=Suillus paluster TaxID=48578 RepID=UPI001B875C40
DFMKGMTNASHAARSDKTTITTKRGKMPWSDLTPKVRGGWRGLMLRWFKKTGWISWLGLVDQGLLPPLVASIVRSFVVDAGVFGCTNVWSSFCDTISSAQSVLDHTTVVLVYAEVVNGIRQVECRQIAKNLPGLRAFGGDFNSCGTPGCNPLPSDMRVFNRLKLRPNNSKVRLQCLKCGWKSAWVKTDEDNKHFKRVNRKTAPQVFWHHFPPSIDLQNFFVDFTKRTNGESQASATKANSKGSKRKGRKNRSGGTSEMIQDSDMVDADDSDDLFAMKVDE